MNLSVKLKDLEIILANSETNLIWNKVWNSSIILCEIIDQIITERAKTKKLCILEIGCGKGLVGLYLALKYPESTVTLSDFDQECLEYAQKSINLNKLENAKILQLDWYKIDKTDTLKYDLVVASDILYLERQIKVLPAVFAKLLKDQENCFGIMVDPDRCFALDFVDQFDGSNLKISHSRIKKKGYERSLCQANANVNCQEFNIFEISYKSKYKRVY
jgi:predicted TPR repeat methyltransferase